MEMAGQAITMVSVLSERRLNRLLNPALSAGLPAFLTKGAGMFSGMMLSQYTADSLIVEQRMLCTPASVASIPAAADQEDFVSMGMNTAIKNGQILENACGVLGIEMMAAAQALDLRDFTAGHGHGRRAGLRARARGRSWTSTARCTPTTRPCANWCAPAGCWRRWNRSVGDLAEFDGRSSGRGQARLRRSGFGGVGDDPAPLLAERRPPEQVALPEADAHVDQDLEVVGGLDALGHDFGLQHVGHPQQPRQRAPHLAGPPPAPAPAACRP